MYVFGPETHMTAIVSMAFGLRPIPQDRLLEPVSSSLMRNVRCVWLRMLITFKLEFINLCMWSYIIKGILRLFNSYIWLFVN